MHAWKDGQWVSAAEAGVSCQDHGLLYGAGLFETLALIDGKPIFLREHLERLRRGCGVLEISTARSRLLGGADGSLQPALAALGDLARREGAALAVARISVSAGAAAPGLPAGSYEFPSEWIHLRALARSPLDPAPPCAAHCLTTPRSSPESGGERLKSFCFLNNLFGHRELMKRGAAAGSEGIFADREGRLVEGISSNLFFARQGTLLTPSLATGALPGIARGKVLDLARERKIPVAEGSSFPFSVLLDADLVFLSSSARGLRPVDEIWDETNRLVRRVDSAHNPLFRELSAAYHESQHASLRSLSGL